MTPKERMIAFSKGEKIDRIPINPFLCLYAPNIGITMKDYYHSAETMSDVQVYTFKKFRHDGVGISTTLRGMAEAMGTKVNYPDFREAYVEEPAINSIDEISKLKIANPYKDGHLPLFLKALDLTIKKIGDEASIGASVTAPYSVAAALVGTENLLRWSVKHPDKVMEMMEIITESNNRYIRALGEFGVGVSFSDPISSTTLIRVSQFEKFSLPFLSSNIKTATEATGSAPSIHICGKSKGLWNLIVDTGVSSFSIDNIEDIEEAKKIIGDRVTIVGNVPPVEVINMGTKEEIYASVRECIRKGYNSPKGYILATGCDIPMLTKDENIEFFMEAGRKYGSYKSSPF